ncbi:integral membrane protein [Streptomyces albus]|uniref:Integral membrane protein n=1 Tax=Streptomyces albus (strain ATCC 21838 / DSM 41398 / FERM P-419 / JCM 4703 / NBRC 107858) TaxID=1081613 RepID=A0A0B5ESW5_STRA4|nr:integral membrane protein [Streptomyces albus]AOU80186.1 integral membrane protein [Streptomyces albus]AYN35902.1 integral membrane protein [Streptomyces albus]
MSTTRHHLNRQRRLSAARTARAETPPTGSAASASATAPGALGTLPAPGAPGADPDQADDSRSRAAGPQAEPPPEPGESPSETGEPGPEAEAPQGEEPRPKSKLESGSESESESEEPGPEPGKPAAPAAAAPARTPRLLLAVLGILTLLLGAFAGLGFSRSAALEDDPATRNTALTDLARTSEVKGTVGELVGALFSYDYADQDKAAEAAATLLTGKAVDQHRALLADVRAQAPKQKLVLTTTVTDSAVERIEGDRARVLVYADQASVSTAGEPAKSKPKKQSGKDGQRDKKGGKDAAGADSTEGGASYAGAVFTLDLLHKDGRWLVSGIDTFGS